MTSDPKTHLVTRLVAAAERRGLAVNQNPAEFAHGGTPVEGLLDRLRSREEIETPTDMATSGIGLGRNLVGLGSLGPDIHNADAFLSNLIGRIVVAKAWLDQAHQDDVYAIAVGPNGSAESPDWQDRAYEIEHDDHACRRFVWLPPANAAAWDQSIDEFIGRTFLAAPWAPERDGNGTTVQLDPIAAVTEQLAASAARSPDRHARIGRWMAILADPLTSEGDLATKLLDALDNAEVGQ